MSEENNLSSNNLCITEDAFEKFQACAMVEEEEFITLADIVSPQPEVPDLRNELNEIPYDNEVVLALDTDEKPHIDGNIESSSHSDNNTQCLEKYEKNTGSNGVDSHHVKDTISHTNKNQKRGRGRRKTKSVQNQSSYQSDSSLIETENDSFIDNQTNQDNVHSTTNDKNSAESSSDIQDESKYPRRTRRARMPNTTKYPLISETVCEKHTTTNNNTPAKRRGRPKKIQHETTTISEPDSTNTDTSVINEGLNVSENYTTESSKQTASRRGRRGRPKASQVCSEQEHPNASSNISDCADIDMPLSELKKSTRRGRKKISKIADADKSTESIQDSQLANINNEPELPETSGTQLKDNLPFNDSKEVNPPTASSATKCQNSDYELDDMDIDDDICLSKIKENINNVTENFNDDIEANMLRIHGESTGNETSINGDAPPVIADFEETIDQMTKITDVDSLSYPQNNSCDDLLVEDTSKRPSRRKARKNFKYDVDSDEDPFANVEISDDDLPRNRKKMRYNDDDEYVPRGKKGIATVTSSDSEINEDIEEGRKQRKKRVFSQTTKKRGKKSKTEQSDIEEVIEPLNKVPQSIDEGSNEQLSMKPPAEAWATSNEFENFIAQKIQGSNLKIKKVSTKQKMDSIVAPLDIPVLKQPEPKKLIEMSCQTYQPTTCSTGIQTSVPYDIPMKTNLTLTSDQSEKACEFLNSVVKTTSELGQLMKEKSEHFMKKKINTDNVTDTFKMDYCVRKSFLLFKLAKHNLMQMEEDLAKQYEEFLRINNLSSCRAQIKNIEPKPQTKADSDSDCEIIDVKEIPSTSATTIKQDKSKANPKTVFLNKELSIKIAKKSSAENDVKQRHTIWINDAVMVKKVKPTQSFLAQDSRNKKPPDYVTEKMVSDFFENYYHQRAVAVCAPFVTTEWSSMHREYACHYFVKCNDFDESCMSNGETIVQNVVQINENTSSGSCSDLVEKQISRKNNPKTLSSLCAEAVRNCLHAHNDKEVNEDLTCDLTDGKVKNEPLSLFRLCYQSLTFKELSTTLKESIIPYKVEEKILSLTVPPLKSLCYRRVAQLMTRYDDPRDNHRDMKEIIYDSDVLSDNNSFYEDIYLHEDDDVLLKDNTTSQGSVKGVKSLFSLCVNSIQTIYGNAKKSESLSFDNLDNFDKISLTECINPKSRSPRSLKHIVYENIKHFVYGNIGTNIIDGIPDNSEDFTINCINTMSVEAFHSLDAANELQEEEEEYDYEPEIEDYTEDNEIDYEEDSEGYKESVDNEWISQVQMQVLSSCIPPADTPTENDADDAGVEDGRVTPAVDSTQNYCSDTNVESNGNMHSMLHSDIHNSSIATLDSNVIVPNIKLEPVDEVTENIVDSSIVKTEPVHGLDGMTIIPESIITKSELIEHNTGVDDNARIEDHTGIEAGELVRTRSTYNVNTFEQFVKKNKIMRSVDDEEDDSDNDLFSRRGVERSEHVPDYDAEIEMNESLLIPQTFEPLHINTKGVLMESSSDDDASKKMGKKKSEKKRGRNKKVKEVAKTNNITKEVPITTKEVASPVKDKTLTNEVAILTRRMREKIRHEEKKIESSDSESDNIALSLRKDKNKARQPETTKSSKKAKQGESSNSMDIDNEIQCNDVDSTEQTLQNKEKNQHIVDQFTGFSAIDQNEISSYQKFMKYVYDKIIPGDNDITVQNNTGTGEVSEESNRPISPLITTDEPVELLECEPTMPIFDNDDTQKTEKRQKKKKRENELEKDKSKNESPKDKVSSDVPPKDLTKFKECDGWHLYPIDSDDMKLYQNCHIPLEKLPESFVNTYLEYQDITDRDNIDKEVDRLANLHTLNRATSLKEAKSKGRLKNKSSSVSEQSSVDVPRAQSPDISDCLDELTPSEDERANVDDEEVPPVPVRATENNLAKNSLMDDHESDSDGGTKKIKQEPNDSNEVTTDQKRRPGPKSKTKMGKASKVENLPPSQSLMLTADKMMNKELNLLHAPIVMTKEEPKEVTPKGPSPKDETKLKKRSLRSMALRDRLKTEDDSSSEEEKQWVTTKEKLLKKVGKKEDAIADDAKRAKLVDDFIERRGEGHENRRATARASRKSRKKMLERLKQQRVLSKELYGEPSVELAPGGKRGAPVGLFKGRRNIRKVIDKKSLQKSTVLANMEEFERKRRLNAKQNQLRELLGYEEGVSVLVINDEVCLEYDFVEQRPVVTVHPFFTKVMKAHQYEGVKFMWDACFESLACIESGRGGGGCILAHCMGLGKTLQVLALLHTVLTHPRANMHRVLVCCPLSTVLNWVDEIHKWIGPVTDQIKVFELSKLKKTYERAYQLEDWYNGGGIFIIGYELFRSLTTLDPLIDEVRPTIINKIRTALLDPGPDIIICDEGHLLKNDCSVLAVAMSRVVTKRRIVLTGTPMQNNLREYYCMVNFIKPNLLGTYSEYSNRFENPIMNGQHRDSREEDIKLMKARTHILHKVLEGCLQRQEASVLYPYLPKKHEYTVFIQLTKCQWDLYKHYVHHYTKQSKQSVLRDFHILQKIWSHPLVLHNFHAKKREVKPEKIEDDLALEDKEDIKPPDMETWWLQYLADGEMLNSIDSSNKFVAVFRILDECIALGDKVLIFSTSLDCLDALECFLRQINGWNLGQEYYRLDGSVPAEVRQKWVREYNAENNHKTKLFLISTRAGCLGLNMTAANRVILLDTSWNPAHDIQSIFRVYRFGQKKDCYIYRLVAMGTMEQKIYERSVTKQAVACRVVDEQQIDRHYNMAELNELYKFDEHGVGVAGGVAVGVADVALLRVARDAAIHAVHEHDSLLRGSGEQELPEYERAAAWMQFQQEHAHKQMQNDIETDKAARALKKLQDKQQEREQLEQQRQEKQRQELERQQAQVLNIKTEDGPVHDLLVPREIQPPPKGRGGARGKGRGKVVQCRIPIRSDPDQPGSDQPGPSRPMNEEEMVQQISDILIKYNFTQNGKGPQQVKELVAKVKSMIQSGKPIQLENCDELTASIARVLLRGQELPPKPAPAMPALTNIELEPKRRGRPRKSANVVQSETPPVTPKEPELPAEGVVGVRLRRRAAIQAERQFDLSDDGASQDSAPADHVIELDDDDWQAAASDTESAPEFINEPEIEKPSLSQKTKPKQDNKPPVAKKVRSKRKSVTTYSSPQAPVVEDSSILLSDDEPSLPAALALKPAAAAPSPAPPTEEPATPLHPSLLSNQNFIKIVAHTYLAGNPMLDEDAATLAAQYSTLKLLKEFESTGKPIDSGPIYDIATKVLGIPVLKKLQQQTQDSKSKGPSESNTAASKMIQFLGQDSLSEPAPAPAQSSAPASAPAKKKIGPKSRVKTMNEEPQDADKPATPPTQLKLGLVPVDRLRRVHPAVAPAASAPAPAPTPAPPAQAAGECILPDDEDVHCITESSPHTRLPTKPLIKVKLLKKEPNVQLKPEWEQRKTPIRVTSGGKPVPATKLTPAQPNTYATISLDSDDDEPPPAAVPARTTRTVASAKAAGGGPVPVALTGPDSKPIPLATPRKAPQPREATTSSAPPTFYPYPPAIIHPPEPVPVSLTGPGTGPVPISLTGPDNRPVPISLTGPGFQTVQLSMGAGEAQPPGGYVGPDAPPMSYAIVPQQAVPISFASTANSSPMTFTVPASSAAGVLRPAMMSFPETKAGPIPGLGGMRAVRLTLAPGQTIEDLQQLHSSMFLSSAPTPSQPPPVPSGPQIIKTLCKPGDILRLTATGQLEVIKRAGASDEVHTIDDDDPPPAPPSAPVPGAPGTTTKSLLKTQTSKAPKPIPIPAQAPIAPKPAPTSKPSPAPKTTPASKTAATPKATTPVDKSQPKTRNNEPGRRKRKVSSSSSSDSSRSPSPDPLSILKDVIHIQAPERKPKHKTAAPATKTDATVRSSTTTAQLKPNQSQAKSTSTPAASQQTQSGKDNIITKKLNDLLSTVKSKKSSVIASASKSAASETAVAKIKDSIDLTEAAASGPSKSFTKLPLAGKKDGPSTVVGTSKSIVLDGKSKSLTNKDMVDLTGQKTVQVTKVKTLQPSKVSEKRSAAPPVDTTATKKKKTEPMTLKDFDIDDIDDIIELE